MPDSPRKKPKKSNFSGNHQRSWLWGHHAVCETLVAGKWPIFEILATDEGYARSEKVLSEQAERGVSVRIVEGNRLEELTRSKEHQGLVARMGPFPYATMDGLLKSFVDASGVPANGKQVSSIPLIVICDRIQDAYNFGAILRCCDGSNVLGVIVGESSQAEVTPHVVRASSGAVNHLSIVRVPDLVTCARSLQADGFQLVAADSNARQSYWEVEFRDRTVLVLGSEAHGISPDLLGICDQPITIPMQGKVTSLNVAVAAGILLYEIRRQQWVGLGGVGQGG